MINKLQTQLNWYSRFHIGKHNYRIASLLQFFKIPIIRSILNDKMYYQLLKNTSPANFTQQYLLRLKASIIREIKQRYSSQDYSQTEKKQLEILQLGFQNYYSKINNHTDNNKNQFKQNNQNFNQNLDPTQKRQKSPIINRVNVDFTKKGNKNQLKKQLCQSLNLIRNQNQNQNQNQSNNNINFNKNVIQQSKVQKFSINQQPNYQDYSINQPNSLQHQRKNSEGYEAEQIRVKFDVNKLKELLVLNNKNNKDINDQKIYVEDIMMKNNNQDISNDSHQDSMLLENSQHQYQYKHQQQLYNDQKIFSQCYSNNQSNSYKESLIQGLKSQNFQQNDEYNTQGPKWGNQIIKESTLNKIDSCQNNQINHIYQNYNLNSHQQEQQQQCQQQQQQYHEENNQNKNNQKLYTDQLMQQFNYQNIQNIQNVQEQDILQQKQQQLELLVNENQQQFYQQQQAFSQQAKNQNQNENKNKNKEQFQSQEKQYKEASQQTFFIQSSQNQKKISTLKQNQKIEQQDFIQNKYDNNNNQNQNQKQEDQNQIKQQNKQLNQNVYVSSILENQYVSSILKNQYVSSTLENQQPLLNNLDQLQNKNQQKLQQQQQHQEYQYQQQSSDDIYNLHLFIPSSTYIKTQEQQQNNQYYQQNQYQINQKQFNILLQSDKQHMQQKQITNIIMQNQIDNHSLIFQREKQKYQQSKQQHYQSNNIQSGFMKQSPSQINTQIKTQAQKNQLQLSESNKNNFQNQQYEQQTQHNNLNQDQQQQQLINQQRIQILNQILNNPQIYTENYFQQYFQTEIQPNNQQQNHQQKHHQNYLNLQTNLNASYQGEITQDKKLSLPSEIKQLKEVKKSMSFKEKLAIKKFDRHNKNKSSIQQNPSFVNNSHQNHPVVKKNFKLAFKSQNEKLLSNKTKAISLPSKYKFPNKVLKIDKKLLKAIFQNTKVIHKDILIKFFKQN